MDCAPQKHLLPARELHSQRLVREGDQRVHRIIAVAVAIALSLARLLRGSAATVTTDVVTLVLLGKRVHERALDSNRGGRTDDVPERAALPLPLGIAPQQA